MFSLDPTVVAVIGTIMGGVGLKFAEHYLGRNKIKIDDARLIRDELRSQITDLKKENQELEDDVVHWREKYFKVYEMLIKTRTHSTVHGLSPPRDEDDEGVFPSGQ